MAEKVKKGEIEFLEEKGRLNEFNSKELTTKLTEDFTSSLSSSSLTNSLFDITYEWSKKPVFCARNFLGFRLSSYCQTVYEINDEDSFIENLCLEDEDDPKEIMYKLTSLVETKVKEKALIAYNNQLQSIENRTNTVLKVMKDEINELINDKDSTIEKLAKELEEKNIEISNLKSKGNLLLKKNLTLEGEITNLKDKTNIQIEELQGEIKSIESTEQFTVRKLKEINLDYQTLLCKETDIAKQLELANKQIFELVSLATKQGNENKLLILFNRQAKADKLQSDLQINSLEIINANLEIERDSATRGLINKENTIKRTKENHQQTYDKLRKRNFKIGNLKQYILNKDKQINILQETLTQITKEKDSFKDLYEKSNLNLKIKEKELIEINKLNTRSKVKLIVFTGLSTLKPLIPFKFYDNVLISLAGSIFISEMADNQNLERVVWISIFLFIASSIIYSSYRLAKFFVNRTIFLFKKTFTSKQPIRDNKKIEIETIEKQLT